ncbi:MAG TPA: DNA alkylation repair protein [Fimbriiglobus sp.]|jgi:3-methyladenine DNA glycosylase AlkD
MTAQEVLDELEKLGSPAVKKVLMKHGAKEPFFGTKIGDMQPLKKKLMGQHQLALELFDTDISDAKYFAGLICDPKQMTKADLNRWIKAANWYMLADYTVAWVTAESKYGREFALKWMDSKNEMTATAGWSTYSSIVSVTPDADLDLKEITGLLERVKKEIAAAPNRVKYTMNGFVIAVGCYVTPLTEKAKAVAKALGKVGVDMGDTSCNVPLATEYIAKVEKLGRVGRKKKEARC